MINRYLLWGLLSAVVVGLTHTGTSLGIKAGDWAAWVGAVGTVGTLIGTIWLATAQTRQKAHDNRILARLHAASMVLRLTNASSTLRDVCQTLSISVETPIELGIDHWRNINSKISSIRPWEISELVPLVPLPKNAAGKLAQAADHLNLIAIDLTQTIERYRNMDHELRLGALNYHYVMLRSALEYIDEAADVCSQEAGALHHEAL